MNIDIHHHFSNVCLFRVNMHSINLEGYMLHDVLDVLCSWIFIYRY